MSMRKSDIAIVFCRIVRLSPFLNISYLDLKRMTFDVRPTLSKLDFPSYNSPRNRRYSQSM